MIPKLKLNSKGESPFHETIWCLTIEVFKTNLFFYNLYIWLWNRSAIFPGHVKVKFRPHPPMYGHCLSFIFPIVQPVHINCTMQTLYMYTARLHLLELLHNGQRCCRWCRLCCTMAPLSLQIPSYLVNGTLIIENMMSVMTM